MQIAGLTSTQVAAIANSVGLDTMNVRTIGKRVHLRVLPYSSHAKYARTAPSGRRLKAACYHGFRDFVFAIFDAGATLVITAAPLRYDQRPARYISRSAFAADLRFFYDMNTGSDMYPAEFGSLCDCETSGYDYLRGEVYESNDWKEGDVA